ncbi:MAG: pyridoxamine 5'-phosphate oxidase family protein [Aliihoeflea sp.]
MDFIVSREELRTHYGATHDIALKKQLPALDMHAKAFIARSPFVLIGSSDRQGNADVTPKGDKPGFVAILDDTTIAIPDRPGNNRLDTYENLIDNPAVGLLFVVPGMNETLRVNGLGRITADSGLRQRFAIDNRVPATLLVVEIRACYMHCAKAFMRSKLWAPESWPPRDSMPTLGQILRDQVALSESAQQLDDGLDKAYAKSMW